MTKRSDIRRRPLLLAGAASALVAGGARAQQAGDKVRPLVMFAQTQGADPQAWQASQLIAQEWRKLGLDVEVRGLPRQALTERVWNQRQSWDVAMWRFIGRADRTVFRISNPLTPGNTTSSISRSMADETAIFCPSTPWPDCNTS